MNGCPQNGTYEFQANIEYDIVVTFAENYHSYFFTDALSLYGRIGSAEASFFAKASSDCLSKEFESVFKDVI